MMTLRQAIEYEVAGSWWAEWCPFSTLAGKYFAWKALRKWRRYRDRTPEYIEATKGKL